MEFNLVAGWVGGLVAAVAMTLLMKMGTSMGMSNMPPMPVIQGAMFTDDEGTARKIGFPTMGSAHPRMESAAAFSGETTYEPRPGSLRIASPGFFGVNYGSGTPMGLLMGHAVYGLAVALVYGAFV